MPWPGAGVPDPGGGSTVRPAQTLGRWLIAGGTPPAQQRRAVAISGLFKHVFDFVEPGRW